MISDRALATSAAVFVTLLWASSYILNQYAFSSGIGPFTLAGLRYGVAALASAGVVALRPPPSGDVRDRKLSWKLAAVLGLTGFLAAQGLQYAGQSYVSPTQASMTLAIGNTLMLLAADAIWLRELKSRLALVGVFAALVGIALFYYPWRFDSDSRAGLLFLLFSCVGYAVHLTLSRYLLTRTRLPASALVTKPMILGAAGMLAVGLALEPLPSFSLRLCLLILWLGAINGSLAFTLWAWSQRRLRAYESSLINNLMLPEVTAMDMAAFGRSLSFLQAIALGLATVAIAFVQLIPGLKRRSPRGRP